MKLLLLLCTTLLGVAHPALRGQGLSVRDEDDAEKIPAQCASDDQCRAKIRSRAPPGAGLCGCYVRSSLDPFDECEGQERCRVARCSRDACKGYHAYCNVAPDDNDLGECVLREDADEIPAKCTSDDQCHAKIRSRAPPQATGVGLCGCYAASDMDPFHECEGQERCRQARCSRDACDEYDVYCDISPDDNGLGNCVLQSDPRAEGFKVY